MEAFEAFCKANGLATDTRDGVDRALTDYLDEIYVDGKKARGGTSPLPTHVEERRRGEPRRVSPWTPKPTARGSSRTREG